MSTKTLFTGAIQALIARYSLKKVFVAVSGGIDSMCLIACLNELKHNLINCAPFDFSAVTIDHSLRDESQEEAYKTSMYLKSKGIDSVVIKWDHKQDSKLIKNMHQKARDARYSLLIEYCRKKNVDCLLTAHNKDDQAETVIMRIMRGSGVDGIAGIPSICKRSEVKIIRPFLEFSRAQIESVYKEIGWDYFVKDPSNENPKYTRASIRAQLKKHLDDNKYIELINRLELLAENAKRAKDFLHNVTVDTFSAICKTSELGVISMNIQKFIHLHEEIRLRLLVHILRSVSGIQHPPRLNSIKLLDTQICSIECLSDRTLAGCQIVQHLEVLMFFREKSKITQDKQHLMLGDNIWDKRFLIHVNQKIGDNLIKELYVKCITSEVLKDEAINWNLFEPRKYCKVILHSTPGVFYKGKLVSHISLTNKNLDHECNFIAENILVRYL